MSLYELTGPLRSAWKVTGLYPDDTWSGAEVRYTRYDCERGILSVHLRSDPSLFTEPQTVTARISGRIVGRVTFPPTEERDLSIPIEPQARTCVVDYSVSPTGVPAELTLGGNPDTRVLGVHFERFDFEQR